MPHRAFQGSAVAPMFVRTAPKHRATRAFPIPCAARTCAFSAHGNTEFAISKLAAWQPVARQASLAHKSVEVNVIPALDAGISNCL